MGKYTGVIFDLDGVICFTDKYHYQAWKAVADKLGIYFDETINNRLRGVSRMDSLEIILERRRRPDDAGGERARWRRRRTTSTGSCWRTCPEILSAEVKRRGHARGMGQLASA